MDRTMQALVRALAPKVGNVTCKVPEAETLALHGEKCLWRGTSHDSAKRHTSTLDREHEHAQGKTPATKRLRRMGHDFVGAPQAAMKARVNEFIGTVRAEAAIAAEEEEEEEAAK